MYVENNNVLLTMLKTYDIIIQNKYFVSNRGIKIIQNMGNNAILQLCGINCLILH